MNDIGLHDYVIKRRQRWRGSVYYVQRVHDYKTIKGGLYSEYVPVNMNVSTNKPAEQTASMRNIVSRDQSIDVTF